jgi:hypothetical protein
MTSKIITAGEFSLPRKIDDESFLHICHDFQIGKEERQEVREYLDNCVTEFGRMLSRHQGLPDRRGDRLNIERAERELKKAHRWLSAAKGPIARSGLRAAGRRTGRLVSASWMRWRFPTHPLAPTARYWNDISARSDRPLDIEDLSLDDRVYFAANCSRDLILAILAEIAQALDDARRRIVELPGGRKPLELRSYLMANLAELWQLLGRRPTMGRNSQFGNFCESVLAGIGWPSDGVNAALPDAIATWRQGFHR